MVLACNLVSLGVRDSPVGVPVRSSRVHGMAAGGSWGVCMDHLGQVQALNDVSGISLRATSQLHETPGMF